MSELEKLRKQIQEIDEEILQLFEKRMNYVKEVKKVKKSMNLPIESKEFEEKKKNELLDKLSNSELKEYYLELLDKYLELSKRYQTK